MTELRRCPFCGREIVNYEAEVQDGKVTRLNIQCCCKIVVYSGDKMDAAERWNTRAFDVRC